MFAIFLEHELDGFAESLVGGDRVDIGRLVVGGPLMDKDIQTFDHSNHLFSDWLGQFDVKLETSDGVLRIYSCAS